MGSAVNQVEGASRSGPLPETPLQRRVKLRRGEGVVLGAGDLDGVVGGDGAHLHATLDGFAVCQSFDQAAPERVSRAGGVYGVLGGDHRDPNHTLRADDLAAMLPLGGDDGVHDAQ